MQTALIVDDLPHTRAWLHAVLVSAYPQISVTQASRRDEALALLTQQRLDLAMIDLGLPDGSGLDVVGALRQHQPDCLAVVVTVYDDDGHLFPALQAGAFGYLLKDQDTEVLVSQLLRMAGGEPPLSPAIARRVLAYFANGQSPSRPVLAHQADGVRLTERETEVLQHMAKGYTLPEIARQFGLSRHTVGDYIKQVYKKLNVSCRAEAALEAARRGLVDPR